MSYPIITYGGRVAHLRKDSTPGFVGVWSGTGAEDWRTAPPATRLDRLTVTEAEARWPREVRALFGGRTGQ
jgi:hypothetical protein